MLPRLDIPTYEITLPISHQKLLFKPFLVKEQQILLTAIESDDSNFMNNNIKTVLKNCCINQINIDNLSTIDLEYYFIHLSAYSVSEIVEAKYRCQNIVNNEKCDNSMDVSYNVLELHLDMNDYNDMIPLTDNIGIKMKIPDYKLLSTINEKNTPTNIAYDIILNSIDYIYDNDNLHYAAETPKTELKEFLNTLSLKQFHKIKEFFEHIPKLYKDIKVKCNKCGYDHKIHIEGLENFLG